MNEDSYYHLNSESYNILLFMLAISIACLVGLGVSMIRASLKKKQVPRQDEITGDQDRGDADAKDGNG